MHKIAPTINLLTTTDAKIWAEEFIRIKKEQHWSLEDIDEDLMIAWFANAMCAQMDSDRHTPKSMNGTGITF